MPVRKFLVILKTLISSMDLIWIRCVWLGLEQKCAELWPSRNWVWDPVYTKGKRRYFPAVWPLVYTKTPFLSQKTIISKNSRFLKTPVMCCRANWEKQRFRFSLVDSEDSDWLAWLYPSSYTAANRFGIVMMTLAGVLMRVCERCYF